MKPWESQIPKTPSNKARKRCYIVWNTLSGRRSFSKVVWLTDAELTLAHIKHANKEFFLVLERDRLKEYEKYLDATLD